MLLTLLIISGVVSYLGSKTLVLDDVSLREVMEDDSLAIYVDDGTAGDDNDDKNYVEYNGDAFPAKADGYKYNADKTTCIDNNGNVTTDVTLYYNNDMIQISTSETVYCYIYFDLYTSNGDWCLANDITDNLGECALVMDDYSYTVQAAKEAIEDKGEADTTQTAPSFTYSENISYSQTTSVSTTSAFLMGKSYDFDTTTGTYKLKNTSSTRQLTDDYIGYYTCGNDGTLCTTLYKILDYTITDNVTSVKQTITLADVYTYSTTKSISSSNGIYMTYDEDDKTYYYRGSVENNYVLFAGFYWRIIRINGDGSVRMIYAGTDPNDTSDDQIGTSKFNTIYGDLTYAGYKYGDVSDTPVVQESTADFTDFSTNTSYYFGTGYEETGSGSFKLSSDDLIYGTFYELFGSGGDYEDSITDYYTCFSTSKTGTCTLLKKLFSYNGTSSAKVYYISYASTSYEDTLTNKYDSTIKQAVDKWYEENIKDKYDDSDEHLLSEYISTSAIFCGDRSLYSTFVGAGYVLYTTTYYNVRQRIAVTYEPTLYCLNTSDQYSVDNGTLDYPIALISADEVAFAGAKYDNVNALYYLYTGSYYWTMSPSYFHSQSGYMRMLIVTSEGYIHTNSASNNYGVRPVINLSSSVKISSGTGTASNPFRVTLD